MKLQNALVISVGLFLVGTFAWATPTLFDTLTLNSNTTAAVSPAGKGSLRYNNTAGEFQQSKNGASWAPLSGPPFIDSTFEVDDAADTTKKFKFDVGGTASTITTLSTAPTVNRAVSFPDRDGDAIVCDATSRITFFNQTAQDNGSNAGLQERSDVANRAALRVAQYGSNTGVPGMIGFKSRGALGVLAPVQVNDVIFRDTAIGVTDNLSIPLSGTASFNVVAVPAGQGWIATEYEVAVVPLLGPANGRRTSFKINSEGQPMLRESVNSASGVVVTGALGTVVVPNIYVAANSRINLTIQDGGTVPTSNVYVSARVVGTSFTIQAINVVDVGVQVYYQIFQPIP